MTIHRGTGRQPAPHGQASLHPVGGHRTAYTLRLRSGCNLSTKGKNDEKQARYQPRRCLRSRRNAVGLPPVTGYSGRHRWIRTEVGRFSDGSSSCEGLSFMLNDIIKWLAPDDAVTEDDRLEQKLLQQQIASATAPKLKAA